MNLKYFQSYFGHRYSSGEIAMASGVRSIKDDHWRFAGEKLANRYNVYSNIATTKFIITPCKVTAHKIHLENYFLNGQISWASKLINNSIDKNKNIDIYYNPILISGLNNFFMNDTHWSCSGSWSYLEPLLDFEYSRSKNQFVHKEGVCIGNLLTPEEAKNNKFSENHLLIVNKNYFESFFMKTGFTPDFSVRKTLNKNAKKCRALIIHSSSYDFAKTYFSSQFSETIEVFSPYVPHDVVKSGDFDRIIVFVAERNSAVVYDGESFNDLIKKSLNFEYIKIMSSNLLNLKEDENLSNKDVIFLQELGKVWGCL